MSRYHIETIKPIMTIDGTEYKAAIEKDINIDFSAAHYKTDMQNGDIGMEIILIPDNMDFLHEMTDIFPLEDYDFRIVLNTYDRERPYISLNVDAIYKKTGKKVYLAESVVLSDSDYNYIRNILIKEAPQYEWRTIEQHIKSHLDDYLDDMYDDMFTDDAWDYLTRIVSARYKEMKIDGYVDFDADIIDSIVKETLEAALKETYLLHNE